MSTAKENPCRKFQANFFNKSKCQNCFKPRELHLLTDQDLTQVPKMLIIPGMLHMCRVLSPHPPRSVSGREINDLKYKTCSK
uniref:Uncharacterized protein n=1 Tax=Labrus bergylta TaxID=56723 RepID=A0A3Q3G298_9LABR